MRLFVNLQPKNPPNCQLLNCPIAEKQFTISTLSPWDALYYTSTIKYDRTNTSAFLVQSKHSFDIAEIQYPASPNYTNNLWLKTRPAVSLKTSKILRLLVSSCNSVAKPKPRHIAYPPTSSTTFKNTKNSELLMSSCNSVVTRSGLWSSPEPLYKAPITAVKSTFLVSSCNSDA